jgi:hypothetical protein
MTRQPVESSNLRSVGYDTEMMTLEVEFQPKKDGTAQIWRYSPVSLATFDEIVNPENSAGAVFHAAVRSNKAIKAEPVGFSLAVDVDPEIPAGMPT